MRRPRCFDHCVMCNLCVAACPEHIDPAHLGQFLRRMVSSATLRPGDLIMRLHEIEEGRQTIDLDAPGAHAGSAVMIPWHRRR